MKTRDFEVKPTRSKTDSSSCFGINAFRGNFWKQMIHFLLIATPFLLKSSLYAIETQIEAKGGYFGSTDSHFQKIYGNGFGMYGVETNLRAWKNLFPWISLDFAYKNGHSLGFSSKTNIYFLPVGLGIKYMFPVKIFNFYTGAGGLLTFVHTHDHSPYVQQKKTSVGGGAIAKIGVIIDCKENLFLDFFSSYSWQFIPAIHHSKVVPINGNLSGWFAGLAIGYRFGSASK